MGYCIDLQDSSFYINAEDKQPAAQTAKVELTESYAWVGTQWRELPTLEQILADWGYPTEVDEQGNIISIDFDAEKQGDEEMLFEAIAPFVKEGSFIHMLGEDGEQWKWIFDGQRCIEKKATITF